MSSLRKLSVSGIRSFDPDHPQVLTFYPLTVILGPNGSGKTTLIECLRYATSGETPPSSNKGKLWVHDTHKAHTVRGQVKLLFSDTTKSATQVIRSIEVQVYTDKSGKKNTRMKTLDATIQRDNKTIANSKCIDIEQELLSFLGVSKAVLTNVIFCHQEDSNWPLSEGKVLKEKFDAIFGSMGYVKALQKLKNIRKDHMTRRSIKEGELALFAEHKERFDKLEKELKDLKLSLATHKNTVKKVDEQLKPLQSKFAQMEEMENNVAQIESRVSKKKGILEERRRTRDEIKKCLEENFVGTLEELNEKLRNFKEDMEKKEEEINNLQVEIRETESKIKAFTEEKNKLLFEKGKLETMKDSYSQNVNRRSLLIKKTMSDESVFGNDSDFAMEIDMSDNEIRRMMSYLEKRIVHLSEEKSKVHYTYEQCLKELKTSLDKAKLDRSVNERSVKITEERIKKKQLEIENLQENMKKMSISGTKLNRIKSEITMLKQDLEQLENSTNVADLNAKLNDLKVNKAKSKAELDNLGSQMTQMQRENNLRTELNLFTQNKTKEEECIKQIYDSNIELMKSLNIDEFDTEKSFYNELRIHIEKFTAITDRDKSELRKLEHESANAETRCKIEREKLQSLVTELKAKKSEITDICPEKNFKNLLASTEEEVKQLSDKFNNFESSKHVWELMISDIKKRNKCPVCCRGFNNDSELNESVETVRQHIECFPKERENVEFQLEEKTAKLEKLRSLRSTYERVLILPHLVVETTQLVDSFEEKIENLRSGAQKLNESIQEKSLNIAKLKKVEKVAIEYDRSVKEIEDIAAKIRQLSRRLGDQSNGSIKTIDDLREEMSQKNEELTLCEKEVSRFERKKNDFFDRKHNFEREINSLESERLTIENEQQLRTNNELKVKELGNEIVALEEEKVSLQKQFARVVQEIKELETLISQKQREQNEEIDKISVVFSHVEQLFKELKSVNDLIDVYVNDGIEGKLSSLINQQKKIERNLYDLSVKRLSFVDQRDAIKKQTENSQIVQRDLEDNLKVFKYSEEIIAITAEIQEEESKLGSMDIVSWRREKNSIGDKMSKLKSERDCAVGFQVPLLTRMRELEKEMQLDKYTKAKQNFRKKQLEVMAETIVCEDLDKYYKALDHSLMTYHHKKMEDINKLVYKFWKQTYRGGDIEYIKISFDDEERAASDRKQSFNYRVVMVKKGGVEMDMRGRCSAGQKVLASLVIRLALAEIFCINCGILALDEPTTNLDKENIYSFANAISQIVESHKALGNFQIIVITHDEEFLKCLDEEVNEYYYRVFKDDNGFSRIKRSSTKERD